MPELVIPDVQETILQHLKERASLHGRSAEAGARVILETAL
jgi:plasmid stability protein